MTRRERQILALIREDPMISQDDIAAALGVSRSAVAGHIMRLTNRGVIRGRGYVLGDGAFIVSVGGAMMDIHGKPSCRLMHHDSNPGSVYSSPGGVARNVAENLSRLGVDSRLISAIGDDIAGDDLMRSGRDAGIDMQHVVKFADSRTSAYISVLDENGEMQVAVNDMTVMDKLTPPALRSSLPILKASALVVADANLPEATLALLSSVVGNERLVVDTVSVAKSQKISACLHGIHTLKCTQAEAAALTGMKTRTENQLRILSDRLHEHGVARVFVTMGASGVFYSDGQQRGIRRPGRRRKSTMNSSGAGDAFLAGIAYSMLQRWALDKSVRFALSAANVTLNHQSSNNPALSVATVQRAMGGRHVA